MKKTIYKTSADATKLEALNYLAKQFNLTPQAHNLEGFAEACFNDNSNDELIDALKMRKADKTDCENWGITPSQWREAIREALEFRIWLAMEEIEEEG